MATILDTNIEKTLYVSHFYIDANVIFSAAMGLCREEKWKSWLENQWGESSIVDPDVKL